MLRPLAENLWVVDVPFAVLGVLHVGARMTVVRLADGRLWLHSPVPLTQELRFELDALGPVGFIVAPNKVHHFFVGACAGAYPEATVYAAPGLAEKRRDLLFHRTLESAAPADWKQDLDQQIVHGAGYINEVLFYHFASKTLITTDLVFNFEGSPSRVTRLWQRLNGIDGRFNTSRLVKLVIRDRGAARRSLDHVLEWPFERIVMAHGEVLEQDARRQLREAFAYL